MLEERKRVLMTYVMTCTKFLENVTAAVVLKPCFPMGCK